MALIGSLLPGPAMLAFAFGSWGMVVGNVLFVIVGVSVFCIPISLISGLFYLFSGAARRQALIGIGSGFAALAIWIISFILLFEWMKRTPGCC